MDERSSAEGFDMDERQELWIGPDSSETCIEPDAALVRLHVQAQHRRWCWLRSVCARHERADFQSLDDALPGINRDCGTLLYLLARIADARRMVAFGTCGGLAAAWLACALRTRQRHAGDRWLLCLEPRESDAEAAREALRATCAERYVEVRSGDPLSRCRYVDGPIDLVFIASDSPLALDVVQSLNAHLRPGSTIVVKGSPHDGARRALTGWLSAADSGFSVLAIEDPQSICLAIRD